MTSRTWIAALAGTGLLVPTAFAQTYSTQAAAFGEDDARSVVAVGVGYTSPSSEAIDFYGESGLSVAAWMARPFWKGLAWRGEVGYDRFGATDFGPGNQVCNPVCPSPHNYRLGAGLQLGGFTQASVMPYTYASIGFQNFQLGEPARGSETDLGFAFGTGVNWAVAEHWGLGVDFRLNAVFASDDPSKVGNQWYSTTSLQFFWMF